MWEKFKLFIIEAANTHYNPMEKYEDEEHSSDSSPTISDAEVKREMDIKDKNLNKLHDIIGENPINQIEYIIENGMEKHNEVYRKYEERTLLQEPAEKLEALKSQLTLLEEENTLKLSRFEPSVLTKKQIELLNNRTESLRQIWLKDEEGNDRVLIVAATNFSISFNQENKNYSTQGLGDSFFMSREESKNSSMFKVPEFFSHYEIEYWSSESSRNREIELAARAVQEKIDKERESLDWIKRFNDNVKNRNEDQRVHVSQNSRMVGFHSSSTSGFMTASQAAEHYRSSSNTGRKHVIIGDTIYSKKRILSVTGAHDGVTVIHDNGDHEFHRVKGHAKIELLKQFYNS